MRGWLRDAAGIDERLLDGIVEKFAEQEAFQPADLPMLQSMQLLEPILQGGLKPLTAEKIRRALAARG